MFLLLAATYHVFNLVVLLSVANLLYKTSYTHFVIVTGFYILAQATKGLAEYLLFQRKQKEQIKALSILENAFAQQQQGQKNDSSGVGHV